VIQELLGEDFDLLVDIPNEVVDGADRVVLDGANFLGGRS
jgi:hypothetical protein